MLCRLPSGSTSRTRAGDWIEPAKTFGRGCEDGLLPVFEPFHVHVQFGAPAGAGDVPQPGITRSKIS